MKVFDAAKIRFFVGISKFSTDSLVFCYQIMTIISFFLLPLPCKTGY